MSVVYLTLDLIKRLARSDHPGAPQKLRDEIGGLFEAGKAAWLPEEFRSGAEAFAFLDKNAEQAEREKLRLALIAVTDSWANGNVGNEDATRGILGGVAIAPAIYASGDSQWARLRTSFWNAIERRHLTTSEMLLEDYPMASISNGIAWLTSQDDDSALERRLTLIVADPSRRRTKNWAENGLHFLYSLCSSKLPSRIPQRFLANAFEQWVSSLANAQTASLLPDDHIANIQINHAPDGRRLHHLLYRAWIKTVPALAVSGVRAGVFNWLAGRADSFCRIHSNEGAFVRTNAVLEAMLRKMPRDRIQLVVEEQNDAYGRMVITEGDETLTSESYRKTKGICLKLAGKIDETSIEPLNESAERAARLAPDQAAERFAAA